MSAASLRIRPCAIDINKLCGGAGFDALTRSIIIFLAFNLVAAFSPSGVNIVRTLGVRRWHPHSDLQRSPSSVQLSTTPWKLENFNKAIAACEEHGLWERALAVLDDMRSVDLKPDMVSFTTAISTCEKAEQWEQVMHLLDRMKGTSTKQEQAGTVERSSDKLDHGKDRILFSCTTFLSKPGKRETFEQVLARLDEVLGDFCTKCLIVNEYDENMNDHSDIVSRYPKFDFIQKDEHQHGQARSLNLILDELQRGGYDYWLQWEEGWMPKRNFFPDALNIMKRSGLDQLQFSEAWKYLPNREMHLKDGYYLITKTHTDYPEWQCAEKWPLFSLQPGINRASTVLQCGRFNTDPENWPYQFEYLFALEFVKLNLTKGSIEGGAAIRAEGHLSTHKTAEQKAREDEQNRLTLKALMTAKAEDPANAGKDAEELFGEIISEWQEKTR